MTWHPDLIRRQLDEGTRLTRWGTPFVWAGLAFVGYVLVVAVAALVRACGGRP